MTPSFYLVTDVETIRDPALAPDPADDQATHEEYMASVPAAPHHRIAVLGSLLLAGADQDFRVLRLRQETNEVDGIKAFIQTVSDTRVNLVTFAGKMFDVPVITAGALRHGLPFARLFSRDGGDYRYRYSLGPHIDLMDQLSEFGGARRPKLGDLVKTFGFPGKMGGDGSKVGAMIAAGKIVEVCTYNLEDLVETAALFLRWMRLRGELRATVYTRAADSLLNFMHAEPRLRPLLDATDVRRFRLVEDWEPASRQAQNAA